MPMLQSQVFILARISFSSFLNFIEAAFKLQELKARLHVQPGLVKMLNE